MEVFVLETRCNALCTHREANLHRWHFKECRVGRYTESGKMGRYQQLTMVTIGLGGRRPRSTQIHIRRSIYLVVDIKLVRPKKKKKQAFGKCD